MSLRARDARGQNRTTRTEWSQVPPYIRFRYERARERLPEGGVVYELGCGIGVGLNYLAESRPDLCFIGFDNSKEAIAFGVQSFSHKPNLRLIYTPTLRDVEKAVSTRGSLLALEVIEHLDDQELEYFKRRILSCMDTATFSFPYNQKELEGTNHLQTIDIYTIFEMFPGFETIFIRRGSMKFIGHWRRMDRGYVGATLGIKGEEQSIARIANWR